MALDVKQGNVIRRTGDKMTGTLNTQELDSAGSIVITANAGKTVVFTPPQYTTANAPTDVEGNIYYDLTLHKLRVRGAAHYETITSV